jgi:hypothetical protein
VTELLMARGDYLIQECRTTRACRHTPVLGETNATHGKVILISN